MKLRGQIAVNPTHDDLFKLCAEMRKHLGDFDEDGDGQLGLLLKMLANRTSYRIFSEMDTQHLKKGEQRIVDVWSLDHRTIAVERPEEPGAWAFPPVAAFTTAGGRLVLAILKRSVTNLGGHHAFCDTDSMAFGSSRDGGFVPCAGGDQIDDRGQEATTALSWKQVDGIRRRFESLNSYRPIVQGAILEIEKENFGGVTHNARREIYCYVISAKRYCLYTLDRDGYPRLIKVSEHGLGPLMDPEPKRLSARLGDADDSGVSAGPGRRWMYQVREMMLCRELGIPCDEPAWMYKPAISHFVVSKPPLAKLFSAMNEGRFYDEQIEPFGFMLIAQDASLGPDRKVLLAPFETFPDKWLDMA